MSDPSAGPTAGLTQDSEPVIVRSAVAMVMLLLTDALTATGIHMSAPWTTVVTAAVNLLIIAGLAYVIRRKVFSPATVAQILARPQGAAAAATSSPNGDGIWMTTAAVGGVAGSPPDPVPTPAAPTLPFTTFRPKAEAPTMTTTGTTGTALDPAGVASIPAPATDVPPPPPVP